jgi:ABC-type metal ion transport system substrate-binding protein
MEKVVGVNMFQTLHYLEQDTFDTGDIQALVVAGLHQLI